LRCSTAMLLGHPLLACCMSPGKDRSASRRKRSRESLGEVYPAGRARRVEGVRQPFAWRLIGSVGAGEGIRAVWSAAAPRGFGHNQRAHSSLINARRGQNLEGRTPLAHDTTDSLISRRLLLRSAASGAALAALKRSPDISAQSEATVGVVGAGVIGLNVARVFAERGLGVTVYAAKVSPGTTSDVAPAVLFPHLIPSRQCRRQPERQTPFMNHF
jgi:hypothetical protein